MNLHNVGPWGSPIACEQPRWSFHWYLFNCFRQCLISSSCFVSLFFNKSRLFKHSSRLMWWEAVACLHWFCTCGYICLYVSMTLCWHDRTMIIPTIKVHEFSSSQQRNMMGVTRPPSSQVDSAEYQVTRPKRALILEDQNYGFFFFFLLDPCIWRSVTLLIINKWKLNKNLAIIDSQNYISYIRSEVGRNMAVENPSVEFPHFTFLAFGIC